MKEEKASGTWDEKLRWEYEWNPRDQMELAVKWVDGSIYHSGRVEYRYCLSCDGALSERIEREAGSGTGTPIVSWQRYEYHGLDLLRVDERYDSNSSGTLTSADAWRTLEVSTHCPSRKLILLGKRHFSTACH